MEKIRWIPVRGYQGRYWINSLGEVWRTKKTGPPKKMNIFYRNPGGELRLSYNYKVRVHSYTKLINEHLGREVIKPFDETVIFREIGSRYRDFCREKFKEAA